jgi:DNA-binding transcriptional MerR regulator
MDEQQLDRLIKALNDLTGNSTAKAKALQSELVALKAKQPFTAQERRQLIEKLSKAKELLKQDKEQVKTIETLIESQRDLVKANDDVVEGLRKVGNSFMGLGKAAFEGSGSISAFTDNVLGFQTLGNRLDVNIETFRQLSQTGAHFGQSIVELRTAAANAALPLDDFASLVANNSQNLAALFGSTTQGARAIANLGRQTRELGIDRLAPLGFTVEEINETLLLNLDNQRRAGVLGQLTDTQRINSSIAFAEQLDRLAKLTGQQRDELRQQIEQQQANERFQAFLQGQTVETGNRLRAFAGTVAGISPQLAEGFQDLIANAGVPVTESALQLVQNIPGARDVINDLISGVISSEQALVRIRDISAGSIDRFRQATVTGQVEFLSLQGGIIELGRRVTDAGAVLDEQNKQATSLVSNLTTFEQASKVLSSQFQSIETGLLQAFGPALGRLIGGVQEIFTGGGRIATFLKESPALTAGLFAGALTGKFLFDKAAQIGIITAGTAAGFRIAQGGLAAAGGIAKGGLRTGVGAIGGLGLAAAGTGVAATAESNAEKAMGLAMAAGGGALTGATIGSVIPGIGTLVGGIIGGALGTISGVTGMMGNRQFGGNMDAGQSYLVGEAGPEIVRAGTASTVVANQDLQSTFNTEALETKMTQLVSEMSNANKTLTNMVNGVNTLVAVESRALKAVETTARKDRNQIGLV